MLPRHLLRLAAILCIGLSILVAAAFFWYLAPLRHVEDTTWLYGNSADTICSELRTAVARTGWTHDPSLLLGGTCDDPSWVGFVLDDPHAADVLQHFDMHVGRGLQLITNQNIPADAARRWSEWWRLNKQRTRGQWVRDGFQAGGLVLSTPLSHQDRVALLELLAPGSDLPPGWPQNAYRLLRESGFNPIQGVHPSDLGTPFSEKALNGLVAYTRRYVTSRHASDLASEPPRFAFTLGLSLVLATAISVSILFLTRSGRTNSPA